MCEQEIKKKVLVKLFFLLPELFSQSCQDPCKKKVPNKQSKSNADNVELRFYIFTGTEEIKCK